MLETTLLPCLVVLTSAWSLFSFARGRKAIGAGAATFAATLALSWAASAAEVGPWMEGGYGMAVLAVVGGYALSAAVASRFTRSPGPRRAAVIGVALTLGAAGALYGQAAGAVADAVRQAPPEVAERITAAGNAEAARLLQLAAVLGVVTAALLLRRRGRGAAQRLGGGDATRANVTRATDDTRAFA